MILGNSKFWFGMALGAIAGAMAYKCANSERAKDMFAKMSDALKSKGCSVVQKAADTGVKVADAVAEATHQYREKIHKEL
ncbi:MAG: hypothetical protein IKD40_02965 [Bacteroidaceae bacterium]|nr:hypothetical protein [Bacteroidaceae bacterium]